MNSKDAIERLRVTESGTTDAPRSIVFVNGFGESQDAWNRIAPAFADQFRMYTFDHAGTSGVSAKDFPQHRYLNLRAYARDLVELMDRLALHDAIVIGHSVGAMVALLASIERPAAFGRLVLIGASPRYLDEPGYHGGFSESDLQQVYRSVVLNYAQWADGFAPAAMANPDRPQLARHFAESLKTIEPEHALTALCAIFQSDHRADLAKVRHPTLIIQSQDDIAVPFDVACYLNDHIVGSRLTVIDAQGHFPHVSAPAQVITAIEEFVRA